MIKRLMGILLTLCMVLTLLPTTAAMAVPENVKDVKINSYPTITTYKVGEPFDTTGLNVEDKSMHNGEKIDVTAYVTFHIGSYGMQLKHGEPIKSVGTGAVSLRYKGETIGQYTITVTGTDTQPPADTVANPKDWPFVPSSEHTTDGMVKSGWKYIIAKRDNSKFRIWDDNAVKPSMRYNYAFYFEHLGNNKYYIRSPYGGYLSYQGGAKENASIVISDKPCKWMLESEYVSPTVNYFISPDENHNLSMWSSGFYADTQGNSVILTKYRRIDSGQMFDISSTVDEHSIPQWWFDLKDGKPAPKGDPRDLDASDEEEYMYYDKQSFAEETRLPVKGDSYNYNVEIPNYNHAYYTAYGTVARHVLLSKNERGTYLKAYADGDYVTISKNSDASERSSIGAMPIRYELPLFGGVFSGQKYNYIAFGNTNREENANKEVIRIVKYDKEWKRISSVSITGGQAGTAIPFRATSARFSENGNQLILHTGRLRFKSSDGLNHQSNLSIYVDTSKMKVSSVSTPFPANHVSHSFDAYVRFDGGTAVFLDLGDANPRSVVLQKASGGSFTKATMYSIKGPSGANYTGAMPGGLEVSSKNYLTVVTSIDQSAAKWGKASSNSVENRGMTPTNEDSLRRNIVVCVLPRNFGNGASAKTVTIGEYRKSSKTPLSPQLLKINGDKFAVLWAEYSGKLVSDYWDEEWEEETDDFDDWAIDRYIVQYIDGNGNKLGDPKQYKTTEDFYTEYLKEIENAKSGAASNNSSPMPRVLAYPKKTEYQIGEGFDITGLKAVLSANGKETNISKKVTFYTSRTVELTQGRPFQAAGKKVVEIRYGGKTIAEYTVNVSK